MKIKKLIKKLKKIQEKSGNIEVTLPQVGDDDTIQWNAEILVVEVEKEDNRDVVVIY
jgi:hypothetical protein